MITRVQLENLATGDLIRIADRFGLDIPPDLDRIFIIEELLETTSSEWPAEDFAAETEQNPQAELPPLEAAALPRQYNITFIDVMVRDPFWAFVFWEIKAQDKEQFEKIPDFDGYYLKVSPLIAAPGAEGVFTIPVRPHDTARYLGLSAAAEKSPAPGDRQEPRRYKVELCAGTKNEETVLAVSGPFSLPRPHQLPVGRNFAAENPALMLSGYQDFLIARKNERLPRAKRSAAAGSV